MRKPIEQRIRELEEQKKALQSRLEKQQRAETTRRRMLLGSFVLERLEQSGDHGQQEEMDGKQLRQWLAREFPAYLSRDTDRLLFVDLLWPQTVTDTSNRAAPSTGLDSAIDEAARTLRDDTQRSTSEGGGTVQL